MRFFLKGPFQESILVYLLCMCNFMHPKKETDNTKQKIIFYALCVLYVLSVADIILDTGAFVIAFVSNNAAFFLLCANQLCAQTDGVRIIRLL